MASLVPMAFTLATLLLLTAPTIQGQKAAPGPAAAPLNITAVLAKAGNFNYLIRLLNATRIDEQINSQLIDSFNGLTFFAPTDNAFNSLKSGTFNSLTQQDQIVLVLYHIVPQYYSLASFQTASNPINTEASGKKGVYTLNVTTSGDGNQVNVSTGVDKTSITNGVYTTRPLAVYSVEKVLLPYDLFGAKPPASPPPEKEPAPGKAGTAADKSSPVAADSKDSGAGLGGRKVEWSLLAVLGIMSVVVNIIF